MTKSCEHLGIHPKIYAFGRCSQSCGAEGVILIVKPAAMGEPVHGGKADPPDLNDPAGSFKSFIMTEAQKKRHVTISNDIFCYRLELMNGCSKGSVAAIVETELKGTTCSRAVLTAPSKLVHIDVFLKQTTR